MRILTIFLLGSICIFVGCNKPPFGCFENTWLFQLNMQIYPDNEEVQIGDTIWMKLSSPKRFKDVISGQEIDFSQAANLSVNIDIYQFAIDSNGNNYLQPAVKYLDYYLVKGKFLSDDLGPTYNVDYNFMESDSLYEFKLGIIPKSSGAFLLAPSDLQNVYRKTARCPKAAFQLTITNTNQHLYIYTAFKPDFTLAYEKRLFYCFKVK